MTQEPGQHSWEYYCPVPTGRKLVQSGKSLCHHGFDGRQFIAWRICWWWSAFNGTGETGAILMPQGHSWPRTSENTIESTTATTACGFPVIIVVAVRDGSVGIIPLTISCLPSTVSGSGTNVLRTLPYLNLSVTSEVEFWDSRFAQAHTARQLRHTFPSCNKYFISLWSSRHSAPRGRGVLQPPEC